MHPDAKHLARFLEQEADKLHRLIEESQTQRPQLSQAEVEQLHKAAIELIADATNKWNFDLAQVVCHNSFAGMPTSRA